MKLTESIYRNTIKSWLVAAGCSLLVGTTLYAQDVPADTVPPQPTPVFKEHQLIVKFKNGKTAGEIDSVNKKLKTKSARVISRRMNAHLVEVPAGETVESMIEKFKNSGEVEYAEPDFEVSINAMPNDPKFLDGTQWGLHNTGLSGGVADVDIDAPEAWDIQASAEGVIVAVIDTGILYTHQDLTNSMWKNPGETGLDANGKNKATNGIDDDKNGYIDDVYGINSIHGGVRAGDPKDDHGHGTHCAGVIGASSNDGIGMAGIAPKVKLMGCKFLSSKGSGDTSDAIECIEYARKMGAHIMSNSWGGGGYSQALFDAINSARQAGIIFVAAAGNTDSNLNLSAHYPSSYVIDNVVAVGSIDRNGEISSFSNYGSGMVHLLAPGRDIYSSISRSPGSYGSWSGTSMATPHVSGAVALLKARYPSDTYNQLINRLCRGVEIPASEKYRWVMSKGLLNLPKALLCTDTRPLGDDSKEPIALEANGAEARASTTGATKEVGELDHAGVQGGRSVWFKWRAQADGLVKLDTDGSSFDTVMAVYHPRNLKVALAKNDDAIGKKTSEVNFAVKKGNNYLIAIDGKNGEMGSVSIHVNLPPANDNFVNRQVLTGTSFLTRVLTLGSSAEAGEPSRPGEAGQPENPALKSVWYSWTAPTTGTYVIDTDSGSIDTVLAVYTGTQLSSLTMIAADDDIKLGENTNSKVTIPAVAGTTYPIVIDGWNGSQGWTNLRIYPNGAVPPK